MTKLIPVIKKELEEQRHIELLYYINDVKILDITIWRYREASDSNWIWVGGNCIDTVVKDVDTKIVVNKTHTPLGSRKRINVYF
jgi:hypothetical protein